jgi:hypothetical protein
MLANPTGNSARQLQPKPSGVAFARAQAYSEGVVTALAEVFRLGTAKVKENLAFRRYLSAHNYSDKPFQILASEVQQRVDRTACANCCGYSVVSVNKSELENIARRIGTTSEAVTRLYTVPDPDANALRILLNSGGRVRLPRGQPLYYLRSSPQRPAAIFLT